MKQLLSKYKILFTALALSLCGAVIRTVLLTKYFDAGIGYYSRGTSLPTVYTVLCCAAVVIFALFALTTRKDGQKQKKFHDSAIFIFSCAFCGFVFTLNLALGFAKSGLTLLESIALWLAVPSAVYFFTAPIKNGEAKKVNAIFSLFVPLWGTLNLAAVYFDTYVAVNDPGKIMLQTALISAMVFFLSECRVILGKDKPYLRTLSGAAAIFFLSGTAIPDIIAHTLGKAEASYINIDLALAAVLVYVIVRMIPSNEKEEDSEDVSI